MIIIGNTFTIFVFWIQRSRINPTNFLLVNLAIADLLVGITELTVLGAFKFEVTLESDGLLTQRQSNPSVAFQLFLRVRQCIFSLLSPWNVLSPCYRQSVIAP